MNIDYVFGLFLITYCLMMILIVGFASWMACIEDNVRWERMEAKEKRAKSPLAFHSKDAKVLKVS